MIEAQVTIVVAMTGSIAVTEMADRVAQLRDREGFDVRVLMSDSALRLASPTVLSSLSKHRVDDDAKTGPRSIDLRALPAILVVMPATANILAKAAHGISDEGSRTRLRAVDVVAEVRGDIAGTATHARRL